MTAKIAIPLVLILAAAGFLASTNLSKANYFFSLRDLPDKGDPVFENSLKVKGRIVAGTIQKDVRPVKFTIEDAGKLLDVRYVGDEPLPDMFKDHAEAVVEGMMMADGSFEAMHVQAKCASKYEALVPEANEAQAAPAQTPDQPAPAPAM